MVNVTVCVGSSCHLKGAGNVVKVFQSAISERGVEDRVSLNGSFCMGECIHEGVSVKIDGELFFVPPDDAQDFFEKNILPRLN